MKTGDIDPLQFGHLLEKLAECAESLEDLVGEMRNALLPVRYSGLGPGEGKLHLFTGMGSEYGALYDTLWGHIRDEIWKLRKG